MSEIQANSRSLGKWFVSREKSELAHSLFLVLTEIVIDITGTHEAVLTFFPLDKHIHSRSLVKTFSITIKNGGLQSYFSKRKIHGENTSFVPVPKRFGYNFISQFNYRWTLLLRPHSYKINQMVYSFFRHFQPLRTKDTSLLFPIPLCSNKNQSCQLNTIKR